MSGEDNNPGQDVSEANNGDQSTINRRDMLLGSSSLLAATTLTSQALAQAQKAGVVSQTNFVRE
jgi:arylsulfatase